MKYIPCIRKCVKKGSNMKRYFKITLGVTCLFLLVYNCYLQYVNVTYRVQIGNSVRLISRLIQKDSILSELIDVEENDSMIIVQKTINKETGNVVSYSELDSMCNLYYRELQLKDLILVSAKRKYNFNYSIKHRGDSIVISFWNK